MNPESMTGYREPTEQEKQKARRAVEESSGRKMREYLILAIFFFANGLPYIILGGNLFVFFAFVILGLVEMYRWMKIRQSRDEALNAGFRVLDGYASGVYGCRNPRRCSVEFTSNAGEVLVERRTMRQGDVTLNAPLLLAYSCGSFWLLP